MAGFEAASAGGDVSTDSLWAATGDIIYATANDAGAVLTIGDTNALLQVSGGTPAWTTTPTLAGITATGDITTTGAAIDWDLKDACSSALSFDASGKAGILTLVTTDCGEGVTMSGTLGVTGLLTATGGIELSHACQNTLTGSGGVLSIQGNRIFHAGGADVPVADGGTNLSVYAVGDVIYASGTTTLSKLVKPGTPAGEVLTFAACASAPSWVAASGGTSLAVVIALT